MKKILISLFMGLLITLFLAGCTKDRQGKIAEEFITKMINCSTYNTTEKNEERLPIIFESYFSEEDYKQFVTSQMCYIYPELFRITQAKNIKGINIRQVHKIKQKDSIKLKYKIEYTLESENKKTKMKDEITLEISKKGKITEVLILNTSDVIHKLFLDIKVL